MLITVKNKKVTVDLHNSIVVGNSSATKGYSVLINTDNTASVSVINGTFIGNGTNYFKFMYLIIKYAHSIYRSGKWRA